MNKLIIVIIGIVVVVGAVFALRSFFVSLTEPTPPIVSQTSPPQQLPVQPSSTPTVSQPIIPPKTVAPTPKPSTPPAKPQSVLDRIEAAIRAKLKR